MKILQIAVSILPKNKFIIASLLLAIFSLQAHALVGANIKAKPPYHIKSNMPFAFASGLTPSQVRNAYGFNHITQQGEGQIIAIVDAYDNPNAEADLGVFSTYFNLPQCTTDNGCFQKIYASGAQPKSDKGWGVEIALDVQWAHAIAPQAKMILVEATDSSLISLFQAINVAIRHGANVISMSWGGSEFAGEEDYDAIFKIPHIAFTAAAGDGGSGILYPAVSPHVISVGGTTLTISSTGTYMSETAWSGSGGGISAVEKEPSYQLDYSLPSNPNKRRGVPDVSYSADPNTGFSVYDSFEQNGWLVVGGTSAGAPQWAALIAVANSAAGVPITGIYALLYSIAKNNDSSTFHDVTIGFNGSCGALCNAGVGYDYVTGIGTPRVEALIHALTESILVSPLPGR